MGQICEIKSQKHIMKLPFGKKKSIIFAIALLLIAAIGFNTHLKNKSIQEIENSVQSSQEILYLSEQVLYSVEHIVLDTRGYILTGDSTFIKPLTSYRTNILKNITSLKRLSGKRGQRVQIDTLTSLVEQRIRFSGNFIEARKLNRLSELQRSVTVNRGEHLMNEVRNTIRRLQVKEKENLASLQTDHRKSIDDFNYSLLLLLAVVVALLSVIFFSISSNARFKAKSDQEIRTNNVFLQTILNTIGEGVVVVNKEAKIILFNPAAEAILGMSATEARHGEWFTGLFHPDTLLPLEPGNTPLNLAITGRETIQLELFVKNQNLPDGAYITISGRPIKTDKTTITGAVVVFQDSTERKRQQDEILQLNKQLEQRVNDRTRELSAAIENLKRNEELLKETGRMARVGGWEIFPQTMTMKWTDELFNIHEIETGEMPDIPSAINYYAPEAIPIIEQLFQICVETGREWEVDLPLITAKGNRIWVRSNGKAEFKDDKPVRIYGALQDITESKKDEQERIKMIDALLIKTTDLEEFTYIVSHNLRAPLANIKGLASLIESDDLDEDVRKGLITDISLSVHRLDDVIYDFNHILQLKLATNATKEVVNFTKVVDKILESLNGNLQRDNIQLITDFTSIDEIITIKSYLHTIFNNLISNCIRFRQKEVAAIINIKSEKKDNKTVLTFADNGIGIDLNRYRNKVFSLYHRCHPEVGGKGMGLYVVKSQVETLGGKISVKSEVDKGTEFAIEFSDDLPMLR